ncbi:hypothetical protein BaRGS_00014241 [Batillaria attramentaria]|uniref:Uncharacterized protein n=1 Tax=Batillaria attramentaria TaxID=370345 RepID=A0ABD0L4V7_9CAEN
MNTRGKKTVPRPKLSRAASNKHMLRELTSLALVITFDTVSHCRSTGTVKETKTALKRKIVSTTVSRAVSCTNFKRSDLLCAIIFSSAQPLLSITLLNANTRVLVAGNAGLQLIASVHGKSAL